MILIPSKISAIIICNINIFVIFFLTFRKEIITTKHEKINDNIVKISQTYFLSRDILLFNILT